MRGIEERRTLPRDALSRSKETSPGSSTRSAVTSSPSYELSFDSSLLLEAVPSGDDTAPGEDTPSTPEGARDEDALGRASRSFTPRPVSRLRQQSLQRTKSVRHLEEALEEGACANVLRHALAAVGRQRCKPGLRDRAAAALSLVQDLESGAGAGNSARQHQTLLEARKGGTIAETGKAREFLASRAAARAAVMRHLTAAEDYASLKKAVHEACAFGIGAATVRPFQERLAAAVTTQDTLEWGLASQNVAAIREAVEHCEVGMLSKAQLANAEAILALEEPREELRVKLGDARQQLTTAVAALSRRQSEPPTAAFGTASAELRELRRLIDAGRGLGVPDEQLAVFEEGLAQDEQRLLARQQLWTAMAAASTLDIACADLDGLLHAKRELEAALKASSAAGLPEAEIAGLDRDRRRLHNAVEDQRGAVRVHCRVRPLSEEEAAAREQEAVRCLDSFTVRVDEARPEGDGAPRQSHGSGEAFAFDACWAPGAQEEVFEDMRDLVQSAVDGYNVTVFAYGQTGAGKTHTMYGPGQALGAPKSARRRSSAALDVAGGEQQARPEEMRGICPRAAEEVFSIVGRDSHRFRFTVMFSMVELYCQRFIDLLAPNSKRPLKIRTMPDGEVYLENQEEVEVHSPGDVERLVRAGLAERHVRSTCQNPESSRSHVLSLLKIASESHETGRAAHGKLLLVDLAGSERVKRSEVRGAGLQEAIEVNRSLTALADVVAAVARGERHVPYRNHELTQVMHDSLGGKAKTLMLVNLSPLARHSDESLTSLKFAQRVKGAMPQSQR